MRSHWSLARQLLVLQLVVLCVLAGAGITFAYLDAQQAVDQNARDQVRTVALTVADAPSVAAAVGTPNPSATLQPY
ncbi:histidine kinase, partial [Amycolatopsis mediterranei]